MSSRETYSADLAPTPDGFTYHLDVPQITPKVILEIAKGFPYLTLLVVRGIIEKVPKSLVQRKSNQIPQIVYSPQEE